MSIIRHEYPILEYSTARDAVINPPPADPPFPRLCLMTFFREALDRLHEEYPGEVIGVYDSEMGDFPVLRTVVGGVELCTIQAVVGSGSIAMMADWLYGKGVEIILCCGSCGVLADIPAGDVILPVRALRDEGASYHYLPPGRFIELDEKPVAALRKVLDTRRIPYVECATWTTDGFYRETREMVDYRTAEGCRVVEMECAAMAAVARFRGKSFGQLLYSGDILSGEVYDDRDWYNNHSARERLLRLTLEALVTL
ncbi:MAG: nucleoside phosphorylase [Eubacteriales bacterium]|jgi:uridine phosphorylase